MKPGTCNSKHYNMKLKLICLLLIFIGCCLVASPNNYCGGVRSTRELVNKATTTPVNKVMLLVDDLELLPSHHFLNNF